MRIIKEGVLPWWVGKRMECEVCGEIVEIEHGDEKLGSVKTATPDCFVISCERCGNLVEIKSD